MTGVFPWQDFSSDHKAAFAQSLVDQIGNQAAASPGSTPDTHFETDVLRTIMTDTDTVGIYSGKGPSAEEWGNVLAKLDPAGSLTMEHLKY